MTAGIRTGLLRTRLICGILLAILLSLAHVARANSDADNPLRPSDTSSPRATLQGFLDISDSVFRRMNGMIASYGASDRLYPSVEERRIQADAFRDAPKIFRFLDISEIPPVLQDTVTIERALQLKEVLERIPLPAFSDIPDREAMQRSGAKRWRLPNTEIDIVLMESGPRAGEYLISADTVDRLPEFYERVRHLPYKPGPAKDMADQYRTISQGESATIYDAFLNSPVGLSYVIPPRWMLNLPGWAKARLVGIAAWQWFGLVLGLTLCGLLIFAAHRVARHSADESQETSPSRWRSLVVPMTIVFVAGALVPLLDTLLRIGGGPRVVVLYAATGALYLAAAWLAMVAAALIGESIVASEHLAARSLDSQLIRLGTRLVGIVAAIAILIQLGDELGFPAYSVLAGLGVGGLAVALAARDTIANLIGSLLITMEKPFRVGHVIRIGGNEGTVEDVGFRSTRIRTADNSLLSIPSSAVVNTTVENLSRRLKRRQRFFVQVTYATPRDKIEALVAGIRQIIADHPSAEESSCQVHFNNFAESSLDILVIFHLQVSDYASELREREAVLLQILALVEELDVELAFPTRTLNLAQSAKRAVQPVAEAAPVGFARRS